MASEPVPTTHQFIELAVDESPPAHPVADVGLYGGDVALLNYLLQDLRVIVRQGRDGSTELTKYRTIDWDVHGLKRRTVICDPDWLLRPVEMQIVGFFGDRRDDVTADNLDATEMDVVSEFRLNPGILSYSSIELMGGQWANLVVHRRPTDRDDWRNSRVHIFAAEELAPAVYHSVRIHNGCLPGGPIGSGTVVIESTKYWDYDSNPPWTAKRFLPGGAAEVLDSPSEDGS